MILQFFRELYHMLPNSVIRPIDCRRKKKYWISRKIIFIHVPKAAGTSISHALYGQSLGHYKAQEIKRWCGVEYSSLFKFSFVRNPWDRIVSAYKFAVRGYTDTAGMRNKKYYQIPAFRSFDSFVNEWLIEKNLSKVDNVFQPQYLFVVDKENRPMVDFLGKVENIEADILRITKLSGTSISVLDLNRISKKGSYIKYYSNPQLINAIGDIYSKDISLFGYDFQ